MRVFIISDQFPPVHFGGMAQHAWHISHYLAERHEVLLLLPIDHAATSNDLPFRVAKRLTMKYPRIDAIRSRAIAKRFKPDVIHVCTGGLAFPTLGKRYPVVTRVVGNDFLRPWCGASLLFRSLYYRLPGSRPRAYFQNRETLLRKKKVNNQLRHCTKIVANSNWTKERLIEEGITEKNIEVVVGGMDASLFVPAENQLQIRRELGLAPQSLLLVTAANLIGKKGFDTVIRAVATLKAHYPHIEYIAIGDGPEESALRALADQLGVAEQIHFIGRRTQQELCKYYQAADLYIQPSRDHRIENGFVDVETMGRTYFEAGGCGIPVIASRVGGVPSVVEDNVNGLLVEDPMDHNEVADKISLLLNDGELRKRLGVEGIRRAREEFSWERVGEAFEKLLYNTQ